MKILFIHERFGALGGAETNIQITGSELKLRGHVTGILHGPSTGRGEKSWHDAFTESYILENINPSLSVIRALEKFSPDVVYVHKIADLDVLETLVNSGFPLIRMIHDHDIYCMRSYKYHYFSRKICTRPAGLHCIFPCGAVVTRNHGEGLPLKLVSYFDKKREIALNKRFHRLVVVTSYMQEELRRNGFDLRQIEIHSPVPRMGDPSLRSNFSQRNLILYAGQIIRGKGVDVLLESLALVKTPFECIILGDGSHRAYCEKLCRKLKLDDRVRFAGFVPQDQLKDYYRECTVFAISSVWPEPFATVGLEVMRYGIPVVAFDAGGIKDWLKDDYNGYLVPWMDRENYAWSLEKLLNDKPLAERLGRQGCELVNEKYDFSSYIGDLEDMFQRVLQGRPAIQKSSTLDIEFAERNDIC